MDGVLAGLDPISLDDVLTSADLQTRVDRKYVVPAAVVADLLVDRPHARVLEIAGRRSFAYDSVYFDTPGLVAYRGAAHGRRARFKVRTRTYVDSGGCVLEVKVKGGRGETVKERLPYAPEHRATLTGAGAEFVGTVLGERRPDAGTAVAALVPTLLTTYRRSTLVDPAAGARITCDVGLVCRRLAPDGAPLPAAHAALTGHVVLETKSPGGATEVDRWLWRHGHRPVPVSKYCVGLAATTPGLPANRWARTLSRYF
jgi:hypothetical protein